MFDFIGTQLGRKLGNDASPTAIDDEKPVNPFPHGPVRFRTKSQSPERAWRRLQARQAASAKRKTNRRFRREWMRNERAFATLRQQWVVITAEAGRFPEDMVTNVRKALEENYGSVELAGAHLVNLTVERAAA